MIVQPLYSVGSRYIRIRETGSVFPVHPEQLKMVKKDLADLVEWNGTHFVKVELGSLPKTAPVKIDAPKPQPVTPPPVVQRTFEAPVSGSAVEAFTPPPAVEAASPEVALAAAQAAVPAPNAAPMPSPVPTVAPAVQAPPVSKTVIAAPKTVDLSAEFPPE